MTRAVLLAVLGGVVWVGCHGPKGSPEGTIKSFFSAAESEDWEAMAEMLDPNSLRQVGSVQKAAAFYENLYSFNTDVDVTIEEALIVRPDDEAVVRFKCTATFRERGKQPYSLGCSDIYSLKWHDGKWYIVLPETQRLRPRI